MQPPTFSHQVNVQPLISCRASISTSPPTVILVPTLAQERRQPYKLSGASLILQHLTELAVTVGMEEIRGNGLHLLLLLFILKDD